MSRQPSGSQGPIQAPAAHIPANDLSEVYGIPATIAPRFMNCGPLQSNPMQADGSFRLPFQTSPGPLPPAPRGYMNGQLQHAPNPGLQMPALAPSFSDSYKQSLVPALSNMGATQLPASSGVPFAPQGWGHMQRYFDSMSAHPPNGSTYGSVMSSDRRQPCNSEVISGHRRSRSSRGDSPQRKRQVRNEREKGRAHRITALIEHLQQLLETSGFPLKSPSKYHVLVGCEHYIRHLQSKARCFEIERQLRDSVGPRLPPANPPANSTPSAPHTISGTTSSSSDDDRSSVEDAKSNKAATSGSSSAGSSIGSCTGSSELASGHSLSVGTTPSEFGQSSTSRSNDSSDSGRGSSNSPPNAGADFPGDDGAECMDDIFAAFEFGNTGSNGSDDGRTSSDDGIPSLDSPPLDGAPAEVEQRVVRVDYVSVFQRSALPQAVASKDGKVLDANDAFLAVARLSREAVIHFTVMTLVDPACLQSLFSAMGRMLSGQEDAHQPFTARASPTTGQLAGSVLTMSRICDGNGNPSALHIAILPAQVPQEQVPWVPARLLGRP